MLSPHEIGWLLEELCTEYGFCRANRHPEQFYSDPPTTPQAFAIMVFELEQLDPAMERQVYRRVLAHVEQAFDRSRDGDA